MLTQNEVMLEYVTHRVSCSIVILACHSNYLNILTSRVPLEGKSSGCLICMKYRKIILIIIIISLGQILFSYIANTSRTHKWTYTHTRVRTHTRECVHSPSYMHHHRRIAIRCQSTVTARSPGDNSGSLAFEINTGTGGQVSPRF